MKATIFYHSGRTENIKGITEVIWDNGDLTLVNALGHFTRFFASEGLARVELKAEYEP